MDMSAGSRATDLSNTTIEKCEEVKHTIQTESNTTAADK